jgi:hypothetical protein
MPDSPASRRQHNPDIIYETEHLAGVPRRYCTLIRALLCLGTPDRTLTSHAVLGMTLSLPTTLLRDCNALVFACLHVGVLEGYLDTNVPSQKEGELRQLLTNP